MSDNWISEVNQGVYKISYKVKERLFKGQSPFQKVEVVETYGHGRMLFNDDLAMVSERDEFIYHEMICHIPLFTHPNPKKVLVIGGGDGGTAREVLKHKTVEKCVMVEIDSMVVEACQKFLPQTAVVFDHPKLELHIDDGLKFVEATQEKFDVILIDSTDPIGPAQPLFGENFYKNIYNCLTDNGIVVSQGESVFYESIMQKRLMDILSQIFPIRSLYNYNNLTYPGGLWSFTFASKGTSPDQAVDELRVIESGIEFKYYNPEMHRAAFCLPQFMKEQIEKFIQL